MSKIKISKVGARHTGIVQPEVNSKKSKKKKIENEQPSLMYSEPTPDDGHENYTDTGYKNC